MLFIMVRSRFVEIVLIMVSVVMVVEGVGTAGELGTTDGYDVGGTRPICYRTTIPKDPNVPDTDGSNYTAIELLNDGMFGGRNNAEQDPNNTVTTLPSVRVCLSLFCLGVFNFAARLISNMIFILLIYMYIAHYSFKLLCAVLQRYDIAGNTSRHWYRSSNIDGYTSYISFTTESRCITD